MRKFSSQQREVKRKGQLVQDNVDSNFEALARKERGLRRAGYEKDRQIEKMTERERQLNVYAKTLADKGEKVKSQTRKWKRKRERFAKTFAEEQRKLTKQLQNAELREEPIEQRLLVLNRERMEIEGRVDTLNKQTLSLSELYDTFQARIEALLRRDKQKEMFEIHRQIREVRKKIGRAGEKWQQAEARMRGYAQALENIHHVSNSVNVQVCVFSVELKGASEARDRDIHQMQYQVELAATRLAEAKRREERKRDNLRRARARIDEMERRVAKLREQEADVYVRTERAKTGAMIAESQINDLEHETEKTRRKIEAVMNGTGDARDKGIDATMKMIQVRQELSKVVKQKRKLQVEIEKAKQEVDEKRRQVAADEMNAIAFMQVMQEIERQVAKQAELDGELLETRRMETEEKIDTSKEERVMRESVQRIEREVERETKDLDEINQQIAEVEEALREQAQKQKAIQDETSEVWQSVTEDGEIKSCKDIEEGREKREQKLQEMKDGVEKLVERQEQLRQTLIKRKELLEQKHQKFQQETGGLTAEEHIGFLSMQDFKHFLSDEIKIWKAQAEVSVPRPMLNAWGSKIDRLFEQLDSFYLTWL